MAKQVSKTAIGGFVISAITLLIAGIIFFGSGSFFVEKRRYVMFFDSSIKGLKVGAPVGFRGVQVGSVVDIILQTDMDDLTIEIPVIVEFEPGRFKVKGERLPDEERERRLIDKGLRAQLTLESLVTGQLMIELDYYPDTPVHLTGIDMGYPEIPTIPSSMELFTEKLKQIPIDEIIDKLLTILESIEKVVSSPQIVRIVDNLELLTENANNMVVSADGVVLSTGELVKNVDHELRSLAQNLGEAVADVRRLLQDIDTKLQPVPGKLQESLEAARRSFEQAEKTLATVDTFVGERSEVRLKLNTTLDEIARSAQALRALMDYLDRHPESLLRGKGTAGGK